MRTDKQNKTESSGTIVYEDGKEFPYRIIKSNRRTVALQITKNGEIVVRLPGGLSWQTGHDFVIKNRQWIYTHVIPVKKALALREDFHWNSGAEVLFHGEKRNLLVYMKKTGRGVQVWDTGEEIRVVGRLPEGVDPSDETAVEQWVKTSVGHWYREQARGYLSKKTEFWAQKMGTGFERISIRDQATRWGSCSTKGNLNYNWKLVLLPEKLADYVVVHELAHRFQMNHSEKFWEIVERYLPDYRQRRSMLKSYEEELSQKY